MATAVASLVDEDFQQVTKELSNPDLKGYEQILHTHGLDIYRRFIESTGLYEYKGCGVMSDMEPELCAHVYVDIEYRKLWDKSVLDLKVVKEDNGLHGLYWNLKYPWPLSNRELTYITDMRILEVDGKKTWAMVAKHHPLPSIKRSKGTIWTTDFKQCCSVQKDCNNQGTKVFIYCYDNPKGYLPSWFINWVAKTGIPMFVSSFKRAVCDYSKFLEKIRKKEGLKKLDNERRIRKLHGQ